MAIVITSQKINASIQKEDRISLGVATSEITGIKQDGTPRYKSFQWGLNTHYDRNTGKIGFFSVSYLSDSGKNKGEFVEVARLIPCKQTGLTVQILDFSRVSLLEALNQFMDSDKVLLDVQQSVLPPQWMVLSSVFAVATINHCQDLESLATIKPVTETTWKTATIECQEKLHWLKPQETARVITPKKSKTATPKKSEQSTIQDAKSLEMVAAATDKAESNGSKEVVTA